MSEKYDQHRQVGAKVAGTSARTEPRWGGHNLAPGDGRILTYRIKGIWRS